MEAFGWGAHGARPPLGRILGAASAVPLRVGVARAPSLLARACLGRSSSTARAHRSGAVWTPQMGRRWDAAICIDQSGATAGIRALSA